MPIDSLPAEDEALSSVNYDQIDEDHLQTGALEVATISTCVTNASTFVIPWACATPSCSASIVSSGGEDDFTATSQNYVCDDGSLNTYELVKERETIIRNGVDPNSVVINKKNSSQMNQDL